RRGPLESHPPARPYLRLAARHRAVGATPHGTCPARLDGHPAGSRLSGRYLVAAATRAMAMRHHRGTCRHCPFYGVVPFQRRDDGIEPMRLLFTVPEPHQFIETDR